MVVQSPLVIPDEWKVDRAEKALADLVTRARWGEVVESTARVAVRFGWNRHGVGQKVGQQRRLRARRVVLPGSVVVLDRFPGDLEGQLLRGVGEGREQGFGALLPHPGIASARFELPRPRVTIRSTDHAGRLALELAVLCEREGPSRPSRSQIAALGNKLAIGRDEAKRYLAQQKQRPERIWRKWRTLEGRVDCLLDGEPELARRTLRAWQDLTERKEVAR